MDITKCPDCGGDLEFNPQLRRQVCVHCKTIWSYQINYGDNTIRWQKWFASNMPSEIFHEHVSQRIYYDYSEGKKIPFYRRLWWRLSNLIKNKKHNHHEKDNVQ